MSRYVYLLKTYNRNLFFSRKSRFYFWTETTTATFALEKFDTRQMFLVIKIIKICEKRCEKRVFKLDKTLASRRSDMYMGDKSFRNVIQFLLALL